MISDIGLVRQRQGPRRAARPPPRTQSGLRRAARKRPESGTLTASGARGAGLFEGVGGLLGLVAEAALALRDVLELLGVFLGGLLSAALVEDLPPLVLQT